MRGAKKLRINVKNLYEQLDVGFETEAVFLGDRVRNIYGLQMGVNTGRWIIPPTVTYVSKGAFQVAWPAGAPIGIVPAYLETETVPETWDKDWCCGRDETVHYKGEWYLDSQGFPVSTKYDSGADWLMRNP